MSSFDRAIIGGPYSRIIRGGRHPGTTSPQVRDDFSFARKNSENVTLAYADVLSVRKPGMSKGAKIGIAAGAAALVIAAMAARAIASLG